MNKLNNAFWQFPRFPPAGSATIEVRPIIQLWTLVPRLCGFVSCGLACPSNFPWFACDTALMQTQKFVNQVNAWAASQTSHQILKACVATCQQILDTGSCNPGTTCDAVWDFLSAQVCWHMPQMNGPSFLFILSFNYMPITCVNWWEMRKLWANSLAWQEMSENPTMQSKSQWLKIAPFEKASNMHKFTPITLSCVKSVGFHSRLLNHVASWTVLLFV